MSCLDYGSTVGIFAPFQIAHRRSPPHIRAMLEFGPPHEGVCGEKSALDLRLTTHRPD